jgi:hypothetical protein
MGRSEPLLAALTALAAVAGCVAERDRGGGEPSQGIHPAGILDPDSPDFHGAELRRRNWDLGLCASCHGEDYGGGAAQVSCKTCHQDGPTACDTCHEATPTTAAHPAHLARWTCTTCHVVPDRWDAPGHLFGERAPAAPGGYDPETGACGVWCHGEARPRWCGGPAEAACGTCHGAPPPSHAWDRCDSCHIDAVHVDGALQLGRSDGCDGCHGSGGRAAPPTDLLGNVFTTARGVGAHRSHLDAPHRLSDPVPCAACHLVPATLQAPGHIDTAPPAEVVVSAGWDPGSGTCANACHRLARPRWTVVGQGEAACGTCHGVPPGSHAPFTIEQCVDCHSASVGPFGNIRFTGPAGAETTTHLNGVVDVD